MPIPFWPSIYAGSGGGGSFTGAADDVTYDDTGTAIGATNVQEAIEAALGLIAGQADNQVNLIDTDTYTVVATDQAFAADANSFNSTTLRVLNSTPSDAVAITLPDSSTITEAGVSFAFYIDPDQTGAVTFVRETNGTINGGTGAVSSGGPGSWAVITVISNAGTAPVMTCEIVGGEGRIIAGPGIPFTPPTTNGGATVTITGSAGELIQTLSFDDTTAEFAFSAVLLAPSWFRPSVGMQVKMPFMAVATSGNFGPTAAIRRMHSAEDVDTDAFTYTPPTTVAVAVPAASGIFKVATIALTSSDIDGLLPNEPFILRIGRDPAVASDATGDVRVLHRSITVTEG